MVEDLNLKFRLRSLKYLDNPDGENPCPKRIKVNKTRHLNKKSK